MITNHLTPYELLISIAKDISIKENEDARKKLTHFIRTQLDGENNENTLPLVFAAALSKRMSLEKENEINIYLQKHQLTQIQLFNLLATQCSLVSLPGKLANHILCSYIKNLTEIALLEIGIGTGRQIILLLEELHSRGALPKQLTIYAIEPNKENLLLAEHHLQQIANQYDMTLCFHAFHTVIEKLDEASWKEIHTCPIPLLVNAAFALHHIGGNDQNIRKQILQKIHQCTPIVFVLCEPNSDHQTSNFERRFTNCWNHFRYIFDFVQQLDISDEEKNALKLFFSREIEDIIGNAEEKRYERHETLASWSNQLSEAGFTLNTDLQLPEHQDPLLTVVQENHTFGIAYRGEVLVGTIIATPRVD